MTDTLNRVENSESVTSWQPREGGVHFMPLDNQQTLVSVHRRAGLAAVSAGVGALEPRLRPTLAHCLRMTGRERRPASLPAERPSFRLTRLDGNSMPEDPEDCLVVGLASGDEREVMNDWSRGRVKWADAGRFHHELSSLTLKRLEENAAGAFTPLPDPGGALWETAGFRKAAQTIYRALVREGGKRSVFLVGAAGSGKSTLLRHILREGQAMHLPGPLQGLPLISLGITLFLQSHSSGEEAEKARIRSYIARQPVIAVLDEAGRLDPRSIDTVLLFIDEGARLIMASDVADRVFRERSAFNRRVVTVNLNTMPPGRNELVEMGLAVAADMEKTHRVRVSPDVVERAVDRGSKSLYPPQHGLTDLLSLSVAGAVLDGRDAITVSDLDGQARETLAGVYATCPRSPSELVDAVRSAGYRGRKRFVDEFCGRLVTGVRRRLESPGSGGPPAFSALVAAPPGSGTSTLFRIISRTLGGSERSAINIAGADFTERHSLARLIGSPQGYAGYDEGGELERILDQAFILLVRNPEAGHPCLLNFLRGLLREGRFTTARGLEVPLRHCVILVATAVGTDERATGIGFGVGDGEGDERARANRSLAAAFGRDFIDAFDYSTVVSPLCSSTVGEIIADRLAELSRRVGLAVELDPAARERLLSGYRPRQGLASVLGPFRELESGLYRALADGVTGSRVVVRLTDSGFEFDPAPTEGGGA